MSFYNIFKKEFISSEFCAVVFSRVPTRFLNINTLKKSAYKSIKRAFHLNYIRRKYLKNRFL